MIWWRPPTEFGQASTKWYDTALCRDLVITGLMARIWVKHFFPTLGLMPANDSDHLNW